MFVCSAQILRGCVLDVHMYGFHCKNEHLAVKCCTGNFCNEDLIPIHTPETGICIILRTISVFVLTKSYVMLN